MTLSELYSDLKQGDSNGIAVSDIDLYHSAINQGFAQKGQLEVLGRKMSIMLSEEGRKYDTYQHYQDRHKPTQSISVGGSVTGSQFGISSDLSRLDIKSKKDIQQIPTEIPKKKSSHDIWDKVKYISAIIGGTGAAIAALTKVLEIW